MHGFTIWVVGCVGNSREPGLMANPFGQSGRAPVAVLGVRGLWVLGFGCGLVFWPTTLGVFGLGGAGAHRAQPHHAAGGVVGPHGLSPEVAGLGNS